MATKQERIQQYFQPFTKSGCAMAFLLVFGLIFTIGGCSGGEAGMSGAGIPMLIVGIIMLIHCFSVNRGKMSHEEADALLFDDLNRIANNDALTKVGITKEELVKDPVFLTGPVFYDEEYIKEKGLLIEKEDMMQKSSFDDKFRYSVYEIEIYLITESFLGIYGGVYNWVKDTVVNEYTKEIYYKDITSVNTHSISTNYKLKSGEKLEQCQAFELKLVGGDALTVIIDNPSLKTSQQLLRKVEETVQAIKTMLREKK